MQPDDEDAATAETRSDAARCGDRDRCNFGWIAHQRRSSRLRGQRAAI